MAEYPIIDYTRARRAKRRQFDRIAKCPTCGNLGKFRRSEVTIAGTVFEQYIHKEEDHGLWSTIYAGWLCAIEKPADDVRS